MSGQSAYQLPPIAPQDPIELDNLQARNPGFSPQSRAPNAQHLQNAIQASNNRDRAEAAGWRGLSQDDARSILRQHGIEITQENVEYLRRDWDYENAGCGGLVSAMRSERAGWGNLRTDRIDFAHRISLDGAHGLSLGQVQQAFEERTRQILEEGFAQAREDARSSSKYKRVMELQRQRGFIDLEGQNDLNLDAQLSRISGRIIEAPSYRLSLQTFVGSYNELFRYLYDLHTGGSGASAETEKTRLGQLCTTFTEARSKLDAAWIALEDYRTTILEASRSIIDDAFATANASDTGARAQTGLNWQRGAMSAGAVGTGIALTTLLLRYLMGSGS